MELNWQKTLAVSFAAASLFGCSETAEAAGYELNSEVKTATPALQQAAQIGVLKYINPDAKIQKKADKDAILVMSFGTTYKETRAKTIGATVAKIQAAHPNTKIVLSFTSHIIIDRIKAKEGIAYPTPEEALTMLAKDGYTRVALASLDIIPGMEYAYKVAVFNEYKSLFKRASIGTPLMYWMGQEDQVDEVKEFVEAINTQLKKRTEKEAVLLLAHGTMHPANAYYSVLQNRIDEADMKNVYVYSVEGWPSLETVIPKIKAAGIEKVDLYPMMMVAGDHATNDMAGDEEDSHKSILEKEGFKVEAHIQGLGENEAIRTLFAKHADEAWAAIQEK